MVAAAAVVAVEEGAAGEVTSGRLLGACTATEVEDAVLVLVVDCW